MPRFELVAQDRTGHARGRAVHVRASTPGDAVVLALPTLRREVHGSGHGQDLTLYAVYRHGRARRRKLVWVFPSEGGTDGGGTAGVREPRRPLPNPPSLHAEAELPPTP
jgi:hypothetical protein